MTSTSSGTASTTERLEFFSSAWAEAARAAVNAGPPPEVRAGKIERYWEWIERAKSDIDAVWGLAVSDRPGDSCLLLALRAGVAETAELVTLEDGRRRATYLLAGTTASWHDLMGGYDVGKTVMYRKLMMEVGDLLKFFQAAYFWTEALGCIQRVPTRF